MKKVLKLGLPALLKLKINMKAFTLIELMIAVSILAVGIVAVLAMFPLGTQIVISSKMTTVASYLGEAKIEEIISTSYGEITSEAKQALDSPFSAYSRETQVTCFDPNDSLSPNCPDTGIKKIKVIVFWRPPFGVIEKDIQIETLISQR